MVMGGKGCGGEVGEVADGGVEVGGMGGGVFEAAKVGFSMGEEGMGPGLVGEGRTGVSALPWHATKMTIKKMIEINFRWIIIPLQSGVNMKPFPEFTIGIDTILC